MTSHAIINQDGIVVNIVIWEGHEWTPPRNHTVVQTDIARIGDIYDFDKQTFTTPPQAKE